MLLVQALAMRNHDPALGAPILGLDPDTNKSGPNPGLMSHKGMLASVMELSGKKILKC